MKEGRGLEQKLRQSTLGTWMERLRPVRVASRGDRGGRDLSSLCLILQPKSSQSSAERQGEGKATGKGKVKFMCLLNPSIPSVAMAHCILGYCLLHCPPAPPPPQDSLLPWLSSPPQYTHVIPGSFLFLSPTVSDFCMLTDPHWPVWCPLATWGVWALHI